MLHAGVRLPPDVIAQTGEILREAELMPLQGYLHRI
jgi:hypothetical protein